MRKAFFALLILLLVPALAYGQAKITGEITGTVVDENGKPIEGADVTASSTDTGLERSTKTDPNGRFLIGLLPVGNYSVVISAPGLQPQAYSFRLGVGETVPVNATLLPGEVVTEEISVYGAATALETTVTGENFEYRENVEQLPLPDRDIQDVAMLAPNVSPNGPHTNSDRDPSGGGYSIAGAPTYDVVVMLDGAEVSDPYFGGAPVLYIEDAVEEVQVMASGVSARYGRFQGGVINAITKSGSNNFEATFRTEVENQSWNSKSPFGEEQEDDNKFTYQLTGGGYVLKDRLWFFGGLREIPKSGISRTTVATRESVTETDDEERKQLKFRAAPQSNHIIDISRLEFERARSNRAGLAAGDARAHTGIRSDDRDANTLAYQGVLTSNLFFEVQATTKDVAIASGGDPALGDPIFDFGLGAVFNNHWWDFNDPSIRDNETISANVTQAIHTNKIGTHNIEAGVQYVSSITGGENRQSSTGFNFLGLNPDLFAGTDANGNSLFNVRSGAARRWEALSLGGDQELENTALYVQDTVNYGKFRVEVGLRWEDYSGSGPLPTFGVDFQDISPRLGVTYNISPNWQVLGTWGKYVARFNDNIANDVTGVSSAPRIDRAYVGPTLLGVDGTTIGQLLRDDSNWGAILAFVSPDQPTTFLANDLDAPFAQDLQFSVRHALAGNSGSISFSYINREFKNLLDDFIGEVCVFGLAIDGCPARNFTGVVDPGGNVATVDTQIWANTARARREYEAFSVQWDYRPSRRWSIGGNYTFGENRGNYEGEGTNTPSTGSPIGDFERSRPEEAAVPFGLTDEDIKHRFFLWGTYRFDFGRSGNLALSGIFNYSSGAVYSLTATVPLADDPVYLGDRGTTYTHFFGGRNPFRFNDFNTLDVSVRYEVPIFKDLDFWVKLTALNALDNDTLTSFNTVGGTTTVNGILQFAPQGNCGLNDRPSVDCTGFGQIRNERDFQLPRQIFLTVGIKF